MIDFWAAFVHTGRPSAAKAPRWAAFAGAPGRLFGSSLRRLGPFDASLRTNARFEQSISVNIALTKGPTQETLGAGNCR
jgi:hypothetical protein